MNIKSSLLLAKKTLFYLFLCAIVVIAISFAHHFYIKATALESQINTTSQKLSNTEDQLKTIMQEYTALKNQDQVRTNQQLQKEIEDINNTYKKAVLLYEKLQDLKVNSKKADEFDALLAKSLSLLAERNYASASANLKDLETQIKFEQEKIAQLAAQSQAGSSNVSAPVSNTPPSSGYSRQQVQTPQGTFTVDIISADLNSTRVIVDTASDSDCKDNCPVLSLAEYVSRSGAFAGINGSYFCPASYPSCAGKTNSFDTLVMNKNKKYINSDNNVYSTIPAVIFYDNTARFVTQTLQWGRDTNVDAVIANYPLLTLNSQNVFGGSGDAKHTSKGSRSFVGVTGNTVYIGVIHNATVSEMATVLQTLGIANSLNLDSGGSTALWYGGYKVGPGRNIPNALLFVRK